MPSPIGHALAGVAAAWTADVIPGDRRWRFAPVASSIYARAGGGLTVVCAALGASADLDLLWGGHREHTHSIGAVMVVALLAAAMAVKAQRPVIRVTSMCAGAYATHLLLDWLGADNVPPYGIRALWPFDNRWYISSVIVFHGTQRLYVTFGQFVRENVAAITQEMLMLGPIVALLWLVRVKAAAGLPSELAGGDHAAQQRTRPVLGIAKPVVKDVEDREADVEADEVGER